MKKILSSLLLLCSLTVFPLTNLEERIQEDAASWAKCASKQLDSQELNLLANFLYCDFLASFYDMKIRATLSVLQELLPVAKKQIESLQDAREMVAQMAAYTQLLNTSLHDDHQKAYQRWLACCQAIESENKTRLIETLEEMSNYMKLLIRQMLDQYHLDLQTTYDTLDVNLEELSKELQYSSTVFKAIVKGDNPLPIEHEEDHDAADLDVALNLADKVFQKNTELLNPMLSIQRMAIALLEVNTNVFGIFYNALHNELSSRSEDFYILFDENGMIESDKQKDLLPSLANIQF